MSLRGAVFILCCFLLRAVVYYIISKTDDILFLLDMRTRLLVGVELVRIGHFQKHLSGTKRSANSFSYRNSGNVYPFYKSH